MQKRYCLLLFFGVLFTLSVKANFDFNSNCQNAYKQIFELKLNNARQLIALEKKVNPQNGFVPLLENYIDYFYLLTNESKAEFERLESQKNNRLNALMKNDASSPFYLYAQAEINLQWSLIRSRYGEYFSASREINKANGLLKDNQKKFPGFHLNLKGLGLINVVIGMLPDGFMKSTLSTFGIKGDVKTGLDQLDVLAENLPKSAYKIFYEEVVFYYAYLLSDVAKTNNAYSKTIKFTSKFADSSLLKTYLQAYVSARHAKNDEAINLLLDRPKSTSYQRFAYLDYLLGITRLNKLDFRASDNFKTFLQQNRGDNYIKDTYLHLAWIALFKNDSAGYQYYIRKVKDSGYNYQYQDKQALNEAKEKPNLLLLKARLLYDGGYYNKSLSVLVGSSESDFKTTKDQLEFHYRLGRIYEQINSDDKLVYHYQLAYQKGKYLKYYFAAKSALLLGNYYLSIKNYNKAKTFLNAVLTLQDFDYENSIKSEAKKALKAISGK